MRWYRTYKVELSAIFPKLYCTILVITLLATVSTSDSLVPPDHVHAETRGEAIATTATYLAASGTPTAFDNEAFSPACRGRVGGRRMKAR